MKPSKSIERGDFEVTASRVFPFDGVCYFGGGGKKRERGRREETKAKLGRGSRAAVLSHRRAVPSRSVPKS